VTWREGVKLAGNDPADLALVLWSFGNFGDIDAGAFIFGTRRSNSHKDLNSTIMLYGFLQKLSFIRLCDNRSFG